MDFISKHKNITGALVLFLLLAAVLGGAYIKNQDKPEFITYPAFIEAVEQGQVASVVLTDASTFRFTYYGDERNYITDNPRKDNFKEELLHNGVSVTEGSAVGGDIVQLGFSVAVIAGVFYVMRRNSRLAMRSGMAVNAANNAPAVQSCGFDDIAGNAEAKESVSDIVDYLTDPVKYAQYGARMPRGILLHGKPGTGKTLMARAMAGEAGVPFYAVSGSDFVQMYVGVGAARVRELFKKARESGKAVIFIDEIDALGKKRGDSVYNGNDEREQTLNALLTEMSGFNTDEGIVVVAATNRPDILDDALLRPGRFDRQVEIALPDLNARKQILSLHAKNKPLSSEVTMDKLAKDTVFFSGAMLECLLNDAAIHAARRGAAAIGQEDIDKAYYTAIAGPEKKDRTTVREQERTVTAWHEAGHALAAKLVSPENTVAKVTIIPSSGGAGGFCLNIPPERMYYTKSELERQIMTHLAGRCAEEIAFGADEVTTGAANDIEKATQTAAQYVGRFGMGERTGVLDLNRIAGKKTVLRECKRLTDRLYAETLHLLRSHRDTLEALAEELLARETLHEEDVNRITAG